MDPLDALLNQLNAKNSSMASNQTPQVSQTPEEPTAAEVSESSEESEERIECPEKYRKYLLDKNNPMITKAELQALIENEPDEQTDDEELIALAQDAKNVDFDVSFEITDPNDFLPWKFKITERYKFMFDEYLFRIPFSKNMPQNIYKRILAWEIVRKVVNNAETPMVWKDLKKRMPALVEALVDDYDFDSIKAKCKKFGFKIYENLNFRDTPYKGEEEYDIFPISPDFTESLPAGVSKDDAQEFFALRALVEDYRRDKLAGKVSAEGMLKLKDMRDIVETDDPLEIRNLQWLTEFNIEKWENRAKVIKREVMSLGEYKKTQEYEEQRKRELYPPKVEHTITPYEGDDNFFVIDGKVCRKSENTDPNNPRYPLEKLPNDLTKTETEEMEYQFVDAILSMEETIKEAKAEFKTRKEYFKSMGIQTKAVERALNSLKRELKRKPEEKLVENEIYGRLSKKYDIMNRISGIQGIAL